MQHVATLAQRRFEGQLLEERLHGLKEIAIGEEVEPLRGARAPERTSEYFVSEMMRRRALVHAVPAQSSRRPL